MSGLLTSAQTERLLEITSPLGEDALVLRSLSVQEAIGEPFRLSAEVLSETMDIAASQIVGKTITCTIKMVNQPERHFHAVVRAFTRLGASGRGLAAYRLEAVPRLWQLTRTADCRIKPGGPKSVRPSTAPSGTGPPAAISVTSAGMLATVQCQKPEPVGASGS